MTTQKKRGRPPSIFGMAFVSAVFGIQAELHPIKTVDAIRKVVKRPEFAHLKHYSLRYLEKKYQEIASSNPYSRLHKQYRRAEYLRSNYRNKNELEEQN